MERSRDLARRVYVEAAPVLPGHGLTEDGFLSFVEKAGLSADSLLEFGSDLFLALACGMGSATAIAVLERDYLMRTDSFVGRFGLTADEHREHRQNLRIRMLAPPRPAILGYRGAGPLGAWLRMTAIRLAINLVEARSGRKEGWNDPSILERLSGDAPSPELRAAQAEHREAFSAALEASLRALGPRERTLLRMHLVDNLNIDAISAIYRVHRSTVARRLIAIRERVFAGMRTNLAIELEATTGELRSLVRILRADLQVSLERVLASSGSAPSLSFGGG